MGSLQAIGIPALLALGAVAAAAIASHEHGRRQRERARGDAIVAELRPARLYRIRARVAEHDLDRWEEYGQELQSLYADLEIDRDPPAAGPEVEIRFTQIATSQEHAERISRRRLESGELPPLALAAAPLRLA